ncbi:uncharacterized protein LOC119321172 [Triticum dicoccoides]|uniref:uncharacterized protein LOC119321172 n=1 Tax=Triticum dicoccoides TaxID=85692 RepID=UPI001891CAC9|nr:uncharacterized protein LOC119321172 [Triticum dicoccoides]
MTDHTPPSTRREVLELLSLQSRIGSRPPRPTLPRPTSTAADCLHANSLARLSGDHTAYSRGEELAGVQLLKEKRAPPPTLPRPNPTAADRLRSLDGDPLRQCQDVHHRHRSLFTADATCLHPTAGHRASGARSSAYSQCVAAGSPERAADGLRCYRRHQDRRCAGAYFVRKSRRPALQGEEPATADAGIAMGAHPCCPMEPLRRSYRGRRQNHPS